MIQRKILIVEDEPIVQLHLQRIVTETGHRISGTASNAEQAFEAAHLDPPELVLMDIELPGGTDGIGAARTLCDRHDCAVVFATAYADDETVERTETVGAAGYITKPFSNAEVRAAIKTAFASRERIEQGRERERALTSILGSMGEGILVADHGPAIAFANETAARLTGWSTDDSTGRELSDVVQFASDTDAESFREALVDALADGREQSLRGLELLARDGQERVIDINLKPVHESRESGDPDGSISGVAVVLRDRTGGHSLGSSSGVPRSSNRTDKRMLLYSHDTFGLGHLQRSLNLMRAMLADDPNLSILLVTGSPVVNLYKLPKGADYVKLPAVRKVGSERYEARSLFMSDAGVRNLRSNLLLRTVRDYSPDAVLVDHAPTGMAGEMLPTLEWLEGQQDCTTLLGLRDIIDEPESVKALWTRKGIYEALDKLYDQIFVYGERSIYDPVALYDFPRRVADKTRFAHYVCEADEASTLQPVADGDEAPLVAVSIGGGDGGAEEVIGTYLQMLARHRAEIDFRSEIITGPLLPTGLYKRFERQARGLPVRIRDFVTSTAPLFRRADLVISTAGYNTATQLLANAKRSIIIPRVLHRREQLIRGQTFERLGLAKCLHPQDVSPDALFASVRDAIDSPEEPLSKARALHTVPLDGAERTADFCSDILMTRDSSRRRAR